MSTSNSLLQRIAADRYQVIGTPVGEAPSHQEPWWCSIEGDYLGWFVYFAPVSCPHVQAPSREVLGHLHCASRYPTTKGRKATSVLFQPGFRVQKIDFRGRPGFSRCCPPALHAVPHPAGRRFWAPSERCGDVFQTYFFTLALMPAATPWTFSQRFNRAFSNRPDIVAAILSIRAASFSIPHCR
jgi:hypothetical protein